MAEYLYKELDPVLPRQWGAQVDYLAHNWSGWDPDKLVIHYGGNPAFSGDSKLALQRGYEEFPSVPAEMRVLRIYEQSHLSRGWRGLAYNYAIGQSGTLYIGRAEQHSGATSGDYEGDGIPENNEARAVLFLLGGDQEPTEAALNTFRKLYQLTPDDQKLVIGHRMVKGTTACPGPWLLEFINTDAYEASQTEEEAMIQEALKAQDGAFYRALAEKTGTPGGATPEYWGHDWTGAAKPTQAEWDAATPIIFAAVVKAAGISGEQGPAGPQGPAGKDGIVEVFVDGEKVS